MTPCEIQAPRATQAPRLPTSHKINSIGKSENCAGKTCFTMNVYCITPVVYK